MMWKMVPIGCVIRSSQYGLSCATSAAGTFAIVGMKDIADGRVSVDPFVRADLTAEQASAYLLEDGDILLNRTNSPDLVGKTGIFRGTATAVFASYLVRLQLDKTLVDPDFVIQVLASEDSQRGIRKLSTRAISQANLNPTTFKRHFLMPLPPLEEQVRLSTLLKTWDDAVELIDRLRREKEHLFDAISHTLLSTGKHRSLSAPWPSSRADRIFQSISRKGHGDEVLLSVTQDFGVIPRAQLTGRVTMPSGHTNGFKLVEPGDFVISLRSFQGGLEHSAYRGVVSPAYTVLQARESIDQRFFRHYFRSKDFIKRLSVAVVGIRDGKQISFADFSSIKLPRPTIDEQREIAGVLDVAERDIELLHLKAQALRTQKRGLMRQLLTGKGRLSHDKAEAL